MWEVGSFPQGSSNSNGGLAPMGTPHHGSDRVWLQSYNNFAEDGTKRYVSLAVRLARGTQPIQVTAPPVSDPVIAWKTVSSGALNLPEANTSTPVVLGADRCGPARRTLFTIHDWTIRRTSGSGVAVLQIFDIVSGQGRWASPSTGTEGARRTSQNMEDSPWIEQVDMSGASAKALEFRVVTTTNFTGVVQMTYGWAN